MTNPLNGTKPSETVDLIKLRSQIDSDVHDISDQEKIVRKDFQAAIRNNDFERLESMMKIIELWKGKQMFGFWKRKYGGDTPPIRTTADKVCCFQG